MGNHSDLEDIITVKYKKINFKKILIDWKCLDCEFIFKAHTMRQHCPACKSTNLGGPNVNLESTKSTKPIKAKEVFDGKSLVARSKS